LPLQIALHGVGGINKMHLDFLIKHERLLDTLRRDVFCKPVIHQQRKKSMEIMRVMMEHCVHEAGKGAVLLLKIARATKYVTRHMSHVTRHRSLLEFDRIEHSQLHSPVRARVRPTSTSTSTSTSR
jgi:hypothetical protein